MADNSRDSQAAFMEALGSIKEYAKVNANMVTSSDIHDFFKDMELDDDKMQMISGYLMVNGIKVDGALTVQSMSEVEHIDKAPVGGVLQGMDNEEDAAGEDVSAARKIVENIDYSQDEKYLKMYLEDLSAIQLMSDTVRSYLLMNIVEDNDKESLKLLTESYLEKIVGWIEPFRGKGVLACDLVQEANLAMTAYIGQQEWLNIPEWKEKIKEGGGTELAEVMSNIDNAVKELVEGSLAMLIDEQQDVNLVSGKILNKVNAVNDWGTRLREELGRKPTVEEVAQNMGVAVDVVSEAIHLSGEEIEDIEYDKTSESPKNTY